MGSFNLDHNHKFLTKEMKELTKELKISNSLSNRFLMAIITGFGTVIGATLLIALMLFILSKLATFETLKPFVEQIVQIVENSKR